MPLNIANPRSQQDLDRLREQAKAQVGSSFISPIIQRGRQVNPTTPISGVGSSNIGPMGLGGTTVANNAIGTGANGSPMVLNADPYQTKGGMGPVQRSQRGATMAATGDDYFAGRDAAQGNGLDWLKMHSSNFQGDPFHEEANGAAATGAATNPYDMRFNEAGNRIDASTQSQQKPFQFLHSWGLGDWDHPVGASSQSIAPSPSWNNNNLTQTIQQQLGSGKLTGDQAASMMASLQSGMSPTDVSKSGSAFLGFGQGGRSIASSLPGIQSKVSGAEEGPETQDQYWSAWRDRNRAGLLDNTPNGPYPSDPASGPAMGPMTKGSASELADATSQKQEQNDYNEGSNLYRLGRDMSRRGEASIPFKQRHAFRDAWNGLTSPRKEWDEYAGDHIIREGANLGDLSLPPDSELASKKSSYVATRDRMRRSLAVEKGLPPKLADRATSDEIRRYLQR